MHVCIRRNICVNKCSYELEPCVSLKVIKCTENFVELMVFEKSVIFVEQLIVRKSGFYEVFLCMLINNF